MANTILESEASINEFFATHVADFVSHMANLESRIDSMATPDSESLLQELTEAIHRSREACRDFGEKWDGEENELKRIQARFRDEIAPWFDQSWFMKRAKDKPRGYPGDYETLTGIYEEKPKTAGFGGYLDRYFLNSDLAKAVRSRLEGIQKFLIRETLQRAERISILDVASGPGREYAVGFQNTATSISLKCVDTDQEALNFLQSHIDPQIAPSIDLSCHRYNALKMSSSKANLEEFGECDIIYSVGLCDYIPDRYLIKILQGWRESVSPEGIVYVAFKDATQYVAAEYQWHVDWYFYERTEKDCRNLFIEAGYDGDQLEVFRDHTNIIMNFVARQPALQRRLDPAQGIRRPKFAAKTLQNQEIEQSAE